jgi:hypothetical protein
MYSGRDHLAVGLPHSEIRGSTIARISPQLIAACHVLHRLLVPRHPPNALIRLILLVFVEAPSPRRNNAPQSMCTAKPVSARRQSSNSLSTRRPQQHSRATAIDVPSSQCQTSASQRCRARLAPNPKPPNGSAKKPAPLVEADGIEPTTPCLQSRCSPTELRPRAGHNNPPRQALGPAASHGGPGKI